MRAVTKYTREGEAHHVPETQVTVGVRRTCRRCGGAGGSDKWKVTGWTCFECGGNGLGPVTTEKLYTAERIEELNARREALRAKREEERLKREAKKEEERLKAIAEREARLNEDPFYIRLNTSCEGNDFLTSIRDQFREKDLSERQIEAATRAIAKVEESNARLERQKTQDYAAPIGTRFSFKGKVQFNRCLGEGYTYGTLRYITVIDTDVGVLVWFSERYIGKGTIVEGKATVKGHTSHSNIKQTIVSNPRFDD